ncbi:MAG TPA: tetratricopeptide repeat protein [Pirellulales bacterium]|nr:tetratricopeptide repeat protein [Pirellulales bacterium]
MSSSQQVSSRSNVYYAWGVCGFLLLAIGLVYGQTLGFGFLTYDDDVYVYDSPPVRAGLTGSGVVWAFTNGPFGEWYPLASLSHMLDCQLFGLAPWGHHLSNVLLHAATSITLFLVFWRMTGELWPSAFVATLFAVHPQHVESVAWVAERRDMLSGLFFMLTLGAWLGYVRRGRSLPRYLLVALLFALGLMSKPMLVTLPPLLLLLDFWPLARIGAAADLPASAEPLKRPGALWLVLEKLPLVLLAAAACVMTLRTHGSGGVSVPFAQRIANAVVSTATYLVQFFYPVDLVAFYPTPPGGQPLWKVAGALVILAAVTTAALVWRRRCPYLFVGWFWFLGMLSPVLGLVKVSDHVMADRYMYLPGIGLYIALAWGATRLAAGSLEGRWMLGTCAGLAIAVLTICAAWQTSFWKDEVALWTHSLAATGDNPSAERALADALNHAGRRDAAIVHYRRAAKWGLDPALLNNLGLALAGNRNYAEAARHFRMLLELDPGSAQAHCNLGMVLAQQGYGTEAAQHFLLAMNASPSMPQPHFYMARLLSSEGRTDEAIDHFQRAIALGPRYAAAHVELASLLAQRGQLEQAIAHYQRSLEIDPNQPAVRASLDQLRSASSGTGR